MTKLFMESVSKANPEPLYRWSSSPIQVSDEDFECRVTKKGKRKECMWVPKSEQFREILPYYKVGVKEMPDYSVNDTET